MSAGFRSGVLLLVLGWVLGCGRADTAADFFRRGEEQALKGEYDQAIAAYEKGLEMEPESAVGHNLLGMTYRFKYNTIRSSEWKEKELQAFERSVACDSTFWPAYVNLGATLYYMGRAEEAAPCFRRALELYPDNPEREQLEALIAKGETSPAPPGPDRD